MRSYVTVTMVAYIRDAFGPIKGYLHFHQSVLLPFKKKYIIVIITLNTLIFIITLSFSLTIIITICIFIFNIITINITIIIIMTITDLLFNVRYTCNSTFDPFSYSVPSHTPARIFSPEK